MERNKDNTALAKHYHNFNIKYVKISNIEPNEERVTLEMIYIKRTKNAVDYRTDIQN